MQVLGPQLKWNIGRILPYGVIFLVMGLVFVYSDKLAVGEGPVPEGAINPDGEVIFFASFAVFGLGILVGVLEVVFVNRWFRDYNLWKTIIYKFLLYVVLFTIIISLVYPPMASIDLDVSLLDDRVWQQFRAFWGSVALWSTGLQLTFSLLLCLIYGAISEHLGHKVLVNFFLGRYHRPKEEERIFLFLDMYDSTTIAEDLGHTKYFEFLQRYYNDLADAIIKNEGEVYQYIGDEIVITWPKAKGIRNAQCIRCFFEMKKALDTKANRYTKAFGHVPRFKGGMHMGMVTTGEVGALKKEIVFTGDVLNTAARIQGLCKKYQTDFLVSDTVHNALGESDIMNFKALGSIELKGKKEKVTLHSIV